ncbi:family 43 glycosylhydrolase [Lacrimispora sp.]|uniref:family 43 glycosylhydrolase n=1 Tax=Lacrimispora sp. TaxID=2719234 RepID=UPI0028B081E5|nr:family 43 glycosylhydrolase [Lacrimispora sp.]
MKKEESQSNILIYTRKPLEDYTESLSNSIHFAYEEGTDDFKPLNNNYGILFAQATINQEDIIQEKGLKNPYLFHKADGGFGIMAVRTDGHGGADEESRGQILLWTSEDLITFQCLGLLRLHKDLLVRELECNYDEESKTYEIHWLSETGDSYCNRLRSLKELYEVSLAEPTESYSFLRPKVQIPNIIPGNILAVDEVIGKKLRTDWTPLYHTETHIPDIVYATSKKQVEEVKALASYSDGSSVEKEVTWDVSQIDCSKPGTYHVRGNVIQEEYQFPLAIGYADPVILPWNHKYYYVATNDNKNDIGIFVRESGTIRGLFEPGFQESIILDLNEEKGYVQTFWAPEFHVIGEDLYLLFAVSSKIWGPQCHMMKLKTGGDIGKAEDWGEPVRVKKSDGSYLTTNGITLDMTYFRADGVSCLVWSYRKGIGTPLDTGSMLYIATVEEDNPTVLTSEPVLLSRPLYGWENIQGTINNEGPYSLVMDDVVSITYSGGAACGYTYALGLLTIPRGSNFLDANAWKKSSTPVLSYYSATPVYGPGHNSFFRDYKGNLMIMYHGEQELVPFGTRCSAMHRVHINKAGVPVFDLIPERDLNPQLSDLTLKVVVGSPS